MIIPRYIPPTVADGFRVRLNALSAEVYQIQLNEWVHAWADGRHADAPPMPQPPRMLVLVCPRSSTTTAPKAP